MKYVVSFVCLFFLFLPTSYAETDRLNLLVQSMALSDEASINKLAAKIAYSEKMESVAVLDLLAYLLATEHRNIDLLSWYAKAIGESKNGRYFSFLENIEKTSKDEKVKNYAKKALNKLRDKSSSDIFKLEDVDIDSIRTSLNSEYAKNIEGERSFDGIDASKNIHYVLEKIGLPDRVEQELVTFRRPIVGSIVTQRMILKYDGLGSVRIGSGDGQMLVERVHKAIEISPSVENSPHAALIKGILTDTPLRYREKAKVAYQANITSIELLDAAAQRVWTDKESKDKFAIDGMAWLLKCIMQSKNTRYKNFLTSLDAKGVHSKIRKYAKMANKSLLDAEVEQFIPGNI